MGHTTEGVVQSANWSRYLEARIARCDAVASREVISKV